MQKAYRGRQWVAVMLFLVAGTAVASGQERARRSRRAVPPPTFADFAYGKDSERQKFDFWQAKSDTPTPVLLVIHGGGWVNGDKKGFIPRINVQEYLDAGISVAALNYRFIRQAMEQRVEPPVKAPLYDAARALQTIRSKASEWNVDPTRIGSTGSSAGACTSLWLALHDDLADPESDDPIARQSTRLTCAAVDGAQTSLDPTQVREWIPNAVYGGHAFGFAARGRNRAGEFDLLLENREKVLPWIKEYSPIELVSADDPPIYLNYPNQKAAPEIGKETDDPTHSAVYGLKLAEALKAAGVEVVVAYPSKRDAAYGSNQKFLMQKLQGDAAESTK